MGDFNALGVPGDRIGNGLDLNVYQGDGLTPDAIRRFAPVAFKKIRAELRKRRDAEK